MKFYRSRNHEIPALNTASLPDLIFSILFFFMLVVHMRKATVHVKYQVPMATELSRLYNKSNIQYIYVGRAINNLGKVEGNKMVVQLNNNITTVPEIKRYLIQLSAALPQNSVSSLVSALRQTAMQTWVRSWTSNKR